MQNIILAIVWACLVLTLPLAAQTEDPLEITDLRLSNYRGNTFVVSWRTNQPTSNNELLYGLSPGALTKVKADSLKPPSQIHFVELTNADLDSLNRYYYYKVRSDGLEAANSPVGYDSIRTAQQIFVPPLASMEGYVVDANTRLPLSNVIVRSYYVWRTGTLMDSTMWYTVLTNSAGHFFMSMSNYRRYSGDRPPYYSGGQTTLYLEILGQSQGVTRDSVVLTFVSNGPDEGQILGTWEIEDVRTGARNGYIRATGPVISDGISGSVVTVTVLDADNNPLPNVDIALKATPERGVRIYQPQMPTDRNGRTWGLVFSIVTEMKTISAINISDQDTTRQVALDSTGSVRFISSIAADADLSQDTVAPFIYFTTEYPNTQNSTGPYTIFANAVDNFRMKVDLLWTTQFGSYTDTVSMARVSDSTDAYKGNIQGQPYNTTVNYIVIASDSSGHMASKPDSVHVDQFVPPYTFYVLQDINIAPTLGITLTTDGLNTTNTVRDVRVDTWITSDHPVSSVVVKYRNTSVSSNYFDLKMENFGAHYWTYIPARPASSHIEYFVQVTDLQGNTERDRRNAPNFNSSFTYDVLSPGSLGTVSFADTTDVLGDPTTLLSSRASALADFNEDGYLDVVVANYDAPNSVYFYNNLGFENVSSSVLGVQGKDKTTCVAVADVNADDYLDVIFGNEGGQNRLYINNGFGKLIDMTYELVGGTTKTYMPVDDWGTTCIVPADFDGDGDIDLYIVNSKPGGELNRLLFNDGKGVFTDVSAAKLFQEKLMQSVWGICGDLDKDGDPDVVVINRAGEHYWMRNDGNGVLRYRSLSNGTSATAQSGDLADIDGDGDLDLVVAQSALTQNELYINDGRGEFVRDKTGRLPAESDETYGVKFFDANADGYPDLYYLNYGQANRLLINDQLGNFREPTVGLMPTKTANSRHASVGDFNNDNRVDLYISEDQWANTMLFSRSFNPNSTDLPSTFGLLAPSQSDTVNTSEVSFVWHSSTPADSTETLVYNFLLSLDSLFSTNSLIASKDNLSDTTLTVGPLNDNTRYWWKVFVKGKTGYPVGSNQTYNFLLMTTHQGKGPDFLLLINRSPAFAGYVTAYIIASEPLLTNPTVTVNGQDVAAIAVSGNTIFRAHFVTRSSFLLTVSGKNLSGDVGQFSKTYSSTLASSTLASRALTPDRQAWIELAAGAAADGVRLLASTNEPVDGGALREAMTTLAGMTGLDLRSMADVRSYTFTALDGAVGAGARVNIRGENVDDPGRMSICRLEERGWQPLPTIYDPETGICSATVDSDGTYALLAIGPGSSQLPRASSFNLAQNSPNPFNPSTFITFTVPGNEPVNAFSLKVYNMRGQVVKTLVSGTVGPGTHTVQWDGRADNGRDVPSGVYFYRMSAPGTAMTRKMVLLR